MKHSFAQPAPVDVPIVLIGLPGAGKTTVARLVAEELGLQVTDLDAEIRRRARMSIPEIFATEGHDAFRRREHQALTAILTGPARALGVIALGGGAVVTAANRELLKGHTVVYLHTSPEVAAERVGSGTGRPLMENTDVEARMATLFSERSEYYDEVATLTVTTDGLSAQKVAAQILKVLGVNDDSTTLPVHDPERTDVVPVRTTPAYDVVIGDHLERDIVATVREATHQGQGIAAIISPPEVGAYTQRLAHALGNAGITVATISVPSGEEQKTSKVLSRCWDELGIARVGRDGAVIGLGGGATTDLAGFVAATWLRGVPVIQVPTTVLGMVDAAVGGKTGINTAAGKNLVGAFYSPSAVFADCKTLASLNDVEVRTGLGEVIKCGFIADPIILDIIAADPQRATDVTTKEMKELISRSVRVKADVVSEDLTEQGRREILNYGHTYAHAIETLSGYTWHHGHAVAVGCMFAAHVAHALGMIDDALVERHRQALASVGLPVSLSVNEWEGNIPSFEDMMAVMLSDKKVRGGEIRMVLLEGIAQPVRTVITDHRILEQAHDQIWGRVL
ncbi:3-dehydroquinate synthase [Actinomyces vulturis]|uniref:3-dehydroquinate synthase n=1 Tax=Actinomyces vulturis TaxID=1857645 RepID=UPI000AB000A2|nr:3-dehydroquinate synthase [Actinomyces vulturis]